MCANPFLEGKSTVQKAQLQPTSIQDAVTTPPPEPATFDVRTATAVAPYKYPVEKTLMCAAYFLLAIAGASLVPFTKLDNLSDLQYQSITGAYLALLPLVVLGHISLPWVTLVLSIAGGLLGYFIVGTPRASLRLKEMSALCLAALCLSAWLENLMSAMFDSMAGYGAILAGIAKPKTALGYALCRAPVALAAIGLLASALRVGTVDDGREAAHATSNACRLATLSVAWTSATLMLTGLASALWLADTEVLPIHPFPFFGGPSKWSFANQQCGLSLLAFVLLTGGIYLYKDTNFQANWKWRQPGHHASDESFGLMTNERREEEVWRRSFSKGESVLNDDAPASESASSDSA